MSQMIRKQLEKHDLLLINTPTTQDKVGGIYSKEKYGYEYEGQLERVVQIFDQGYHAQLTAAGVWAKVQGNANLPELQQARTVTLGGEGNFVGAPMPFTISVTSNDVRSFSFVPGPVTFESYTDIADIELDEIAERMRRADRAEYRDHLKGSYVALTVFYANSFVLTFNSTNIGGAQAAISGNLVVDASLNVAWQNSNSLTLSGATGVPFAFSGPKLGRRGVKD